MSTINRLVGMAKKAIDQNSSSPERSSGPGGQSRSSDWRSMVRSAADAITGEGDGDQRGRQDTRRAAAAPAPAPAPQGPREARRPQESGLSDTDRRAIARYDYLVRTAEPDQLEQVHREAFERLTPQQRAQLRSTMREELPGSERPRTDAPQDLARSATRLGVLDPRKLTRLLTRSGRGGDARGAGALGAGAIGAAGGLLGVVAGGAIVTGVGGSLLQDALGAGIDVDDLTEGLGADLGGLTEGVGGSVTDAGEQFSGFGEQVSDLGLEDLFGR